MFVFNVLLLKFKVGNEIFADVKCRVCTPELSDNLVGFIFL